MSAAHAAVKHELLVRYLDAWTPAVLHRHKRATYVEADTDGAAAVAALRVFGEFADLLDRHTLTMLLLGSDAAHVSATARRLTEVAGEYQSPPGLGVHTIVGVDELVPALVRAKAVGSPIFAWFDWSGSTAGSAAGSAEPPDESEAVSIVARYKGSELLLALPATTPTGHLGSLREAGLVETARVELVDRVGVAETLVFATSSAKALETFKDELWALDEYAGIRYRDPIDEEGTLLDISLQPNLGPLRRALTGCLARAGESTVASLREWTLHETIYRAADATRAVQALVASGVVTRTPASGRLAPGTLIDRSAA